MSWWKTAKPGDKVVCVEPRVFDCLGRLSSTKSGLIEGNVYEIKRIFESSGNNPLRGCKTTFVLDGVSPPEEWETNVGGYAAIRFRPVQTRSTEAGMTTLRNLLNTKPHDKLVEA